MLVYRHDGTQYEKVQEFDVGFSIFGLVLGSLRLIVSGVSSEILLYRSNGTTFSQEQRITTNETVIHEISPSSDLTRFSFGGASKYASLYEETNGSYSLKDKIFIGEAVLEVHQSKEELYIMIETQNEMLTYYKCPGECTACFFPNNCTSCISGHILQEGVCSEASHCVKNSLKKNNVCEEYCSRQCKTCNQTKDDCVECA